MCLVLFVRASRSPVHARIVRYLVHARTSVLDLARVERKFLNLDDTFSPHVRDMGVLHVPVRESKLSTIDSRFRHLRQADTIHPATVVLHPAVHKASCFVRRHVEEFATSSLNEFADDLCASLETMLKADIDTAVEQSACARFAGLTTWGGRLFQQLLRFAWSA